MLYLIMIILMALKCKNHKVGKYSQMAHMLLYIQELNATHSFTHVAHLSLFLA